ncbi:hypothetical protein BKA93DRAFT_743850 [Sparassis latifolia]|uniref:CDP-diacylglycerol--glycerol-3-phosphate 3-phosphatidyltransferase n=1 Tax=Sparassis crispa TaxID=139825 RepID=A0A401GI58_9APHY|nr:CDP-diacylglycerol--glycerol-3-phosphate 3-phosphatidyltransferase [Sparassis crispa]GBE81880.1 CDP-diacylglycerol--glycerol-3-phosphate 3-phosphatidyltransferase [Sparassis crispa]
MFAAILFSRTVSRHYDRKLANVAVHRSRSLSTVSFDPFIRQFVSKLAERQPCFPMSSSDVHIMHEPQDFYQCLLDMIRRARRRIFISSLYIGSEDVELIDALHVSLQQNPSLKIHIHLDFNRSTRPGPQSTARLLLPLLQEYPNRVCVALFRSPKLKGIMAKLVPPRFNEGWGTWHPKIYGADDDVLISGANLNTSYFSNRQDRYLRFTAQPQLAGYCFDFLQHASGFSYSLLPSPLSKEEYTLQWPDEHTHPHYIETKAQRSLRSFQNSHLAESPQLLDDQLASTSSLEKIDVEKLNVNQPDVLVFPVIQAGLFDIREEEDSLALLFDELGTHTPTSTSPSYGGPLMDLTSGYFGLYKPYQDLVLRSGVACRILAASPKANGFYGSKGVSGRIPEGYTLLEKRFMRAVRHSGREWTQDQQECRPGVQLNEWEKKGWTYHAKGIWLRPTPNASPLLTLFGSTNLNSRSSNLDTELSFLLVTSAPELRARLAEEADGLRAHAQPWRGEERKVRIGTRVLVSAVGGML